jgi:hypothetical protein
MADFDKESARIRKNKILDRAVEANRILKGDVIDYYWEKNPQTQEEAAQDIRSIYKYLKQSQEIIGSLISSLEN